MKFTEEEYNHLSLSQRKHFAKIIWQHRPDIKRLLNDTAKELGMPTSIVEEVVMFQFKLLKQIMSGYTYMTFRFGYLGMFAVIRGQAMDRNPLRESQVEFDNRMDAHKQATIDFINLLHTKQRRKGKKTSSHTKQITSSNI